MFAHECFKTAVNYLDRIPQEPKELFELPLWAFKYTADAKMGGSRPSSICN